jgi:prefoldin subunit 5
MQSSAPFFSNDLTGVIKLIVSLGSMIAIVTGVVVKWGQSALMKQLDKLEHDMDEIGKKLNRTDETCTKSSTRHEELRTRFDRKESVIEGLLVTQGKQEASIKSASDLVNVNQNSVIVMLNDQMRERDKEITALKVEIGKLQERNETRTIVKELLMTLEARGKD